MLKKERTAHKKKSKDAGIPIDPALLSEIQLIDMIYWKYRSQQHNQRWFKYLSILHRRLARFVQTNSVDLNSASFIVYKLAKPAAVAFQGILNQGAFITLGFALIALLARVYSILHALVPKRAVTQARLQKSIRNTDLGDDLGIEIDDDVTEDYLHPSTPHPTHSTRISGNSGTNSATNNGTSDDLIPKIDSKTTKTKLKSSAINPVTLDNKNTNASATNKTSKPASSTISATKSKTTKKPLKPLKPGKTGKPKKKSIIDDIFK